MKFVNRKALASALIACLCWGVFARPNTAEDAVKQNIFVEKGSFCNFKDARCKLGKASRLE